MTVDTRQESSHPQAQRANVEQLETSIQRQGCQPSGACGRPGPQGGRQPQPAHAKPLLTVDQQIAHMKDKGITFCLCSEADAAGHLRAKCQFFRIYAYRKNFDKHVGGGLDGKYVGLDFGQLRLLSNTDRMLRDLLLVMTPDVEHFAKVRLLALAEDHGEDGYGVLRDYLASASRNQRSYIQSEIDRREGSPYSGDMVRKYRDDMLWKLEGLLWEVG